MSLWKGLRGRCALPAPPPRPPPTPPHPPLRAVNQYRRLSLSCAITYNSQYYNILKSYSGGTVPHHGGTTLQCSDGSSTGRFDFYMVDTKAPPILSLHTWTFLGLIQKGPNSLLLSGEAVTSVAPPQPDLTLDKVKADYVYLFTGGSLTHRTTLNWIRPFSQSSSHLVVCLSANMGAGRPNCLTWRHRVSFPRWMDQ